MEKRNLIENVVLISIDNLRKDGLSCYGSRFSTPTIDYLASKGVKFENCMTSSNVSTTSHASILTGKHPFRHKARMNGDNLDDYEIQLVSEALVTEGIVTAASVSSSLLSKLHKFNRGFQYFSDYSRITSIPKIGSKKVNSITVLRALLNVMKINSNKSDFRTNKDVKKILDKINNQSFFFFIHYSDAHHKLGDKKWIKDVEQNRKNKNISKRQSAKELFMARQSCCDASIADLVKILREKGVFDNTLLIITADHGESLYEHVLHPNPSQRPDLPLSENGTYKGHGFSMYDEEILVPLIFSHPSLNSKEIPSLVRTIDIAPTILDAFGIENSLDMDGISLYPLIQSEDKFKLEKLTGYAETSPLVHDLKCLRDDNWKFIRNKSGRDELYNIEGDPSEKNNVIEIEKKILVNFEKKLDKLLQHSHHSEFSIKDLDGSVKQELRELGYLK